MFGMGLSKAELRIKLKSERRALPNVQADEASRKIEASCIELIDWGNIQSLHAYVPVMKENEVDCWHVVEYAWQHYPSVQTTVPVLNKTGDYNSVVVTPTTTWQRKRRIPEPTSGKVLAKSSKFDVILVPMLGFDAKGHRLGHGKGWYDRFLPTQPNALTIGLCYEFGCVADGLPREAHDIALDYVVSEQQVWKIT